MKSSYRCQWFEGHLMAFSVFLDVKTDNVTMDTQKRKRYFPSKYMGKTDFFIKKKHVHIYDTIRLRIIHNEYWKWIAIVRLSDICDDREKISDSKLF